jgi:hypothetical protein
MTRFHRWSRRRLVASSLVAVSVAALAGTALAGHVGSGVTSYTGCLVPKDGVIIKVKAGDAPASPCTAGMTQVHLSGGDITKISVTGGLTGGGDNGEVTIGLDPKYGLPQGCDSLQFPMKSSSGWTCADHELGTGLSLSRAVGSGGGSITYGIASQYRVQNTPDCSSGQFATGFADDGTIQCSAPATPSLQPYGATQSEPGFASGAGVPDNGAWHTYAAATVPAGTYLLTGKGVLVQGDDDIGFRSPDGIGCRLAMGSQPIDRIGFAPKDNEPDDYGFSLTGTVTTSGGEIVLQCQAEDDADQVEVSFARFVALRIG